MLEHLLSKPKKCWNIYKVNQRNVRRYTEAHFCVVIISQFVNRKQQKTQEKQRHLKVTFKITGYALLP